MSLFQMVNYLLLFLILLKNARVFKSLRARGDAAEAGSPDLSNLPTHTILHIPISMSTKLFPASNLQEMQLIT